MRRRESSADLQPQDVCRLQDPRFDAGYVSSFGPVNASPSQIVLFGTVGRAVYGDGVAATHSGTSHLRLPTSARTAANSATHAIGILVVFRHGPAAPAMNQWIAALGSDSGSSGNTLFGITAASTTTSLLRVVYGGDVFNDASGDIAGTTFNDGKAHAALLTVTGFTSINACAARCFFDGRLVYDVAAGSSLGQATYRHIVAGGTRRAADFGGFDGQTFWTQSIVGRVSDQEGKAWTANPWRLFERIRPSRRFAVAAASGFNPAWAVRANTVIQRAL